MGEAGAPDPAGAAGPAGSGVEERERLRAAGALIGVPVEVTEADEWVLDGSGLRVGLGWYARRGHGREEAVALALLQLWESVRAERVAPERSRRARSIAAARPELHPLVAAVVRLQAASEMLAAMPGLRARLATALARGLADGLGDAGLGAQPRHLQWVALLLAAGTGAGAPLDQAAPEVVAEWEALAEIERLIASAPEEVLRRVLAPDHRRTPLARFERALALLIPSYERLLARDAEEHGLTDAGAVGDGQTNENDAAAEALGASAPGAKADDAGAGAEDDAAADPTATPGDDERARAGEGRQAAEGADLFAAEQAGFVDTVLATPLPAEGALLEALELADQESSARASDAPREAGGGGAASSGRGIADYRVRAQALSEAIERMRDVWARVIAERAAEVRAPGRRPAPDGETLSPDALARVVAEARAGAAHPAAFVPRESRPRRRHRSGSTDYVLLVDRSASMQGRFADAAADAALIMMEALAGVERDIENAERRSRIELELDIRTALVLFDAEAHVVKPLSRGLDDAVRRGMHTGIRTPRGSTNDGAALRAAAAELGIRHRGIGSRGIGNRGIKSTSPAAGDGTERRRIVLLVSDGGSNDPAAAARELRALRAAGVEVHGIGVGSDDVTHRYAPTSRRIDEPGEIAAAILDLIERELP
ncbi:vWA domain-containing protein [Leucobacter sp. USHLN153]|uniref:vWA domain-containing protein n=1 Tax=Leucobacter sp. USHLN153 TaxID=3081268 RepID=UPI003019EEB7